MSTTILSDLTVDEPLEMDANYEFNRVDRRYIDDQILGIERHLVDGVINGRQATWFTLGGSASVVAGDVVCLAGVAGFVTKADTAGLTSAGSALGVVIQGASPGEKVFVAIGGILPPSITGLATSAPGPVRVNGTTGRLERIVSVTSFDYVLGSVDVAGWLRLGVATPHLTTRNLSLLSDFASTTATTAQNTNLTFPVLSTDVWLVEFGGNWSVASGTSGAKLAFAIPTGAVIEGNAHGELATGLSTYTSIRINAGSTLGGPFNTVAATTEGVWGAVRVKMDGTNAGSITFQVAPVAAVVLTLKAGFWMRATRVTEV